MRSPLVHFNAVSPLDELLEARRGKRSIGGTARRDLLRYYEVLKSVEGEVKFPESEANLLVDALGGLGESTDLVESFKTAIKERKLSDKWGVDGEALVNRFAGLSKASQYCVLDAVERFWAGSDMALSARRLREVGLI